MNSMFSLCQTLCMNSICKMLNGFSCSYSPLYPFLASEKSAAKGLSLLFFTLNLSLEPISFFWFFRFLSGLVLPARSEVNLANARIGSFCMECQNGHCLCMDNAKVVTVFDLELN